METRYQIVGTNDDRDMMTLAQLEIRQTVTGEETGRHLRPELQNQPKLANMCGPHVGRLAQRRWRVALPRRRPRPDERDQALLQGARAGRLRRRPL